MERRNTDSGMAVSGRIEAKSYDVSELRSQIDGWDDMSRDEKYDAVQDFEPEETVTESNVTCVGLHEYIVDNLDPDTTASQAASHLALGVDDTAESSGDTALGDEQYRQEVSDHAQDGNELLASTFIDSQSGNNNTYTELGLTTETGTGNGILLNHATFAGITKDNTRTVTFDVRLTFNPA